jgi:hypothetical protein
MDVLRDGRDGPPLQPDPVIVVTGKTSLVNQLVEKSSISYFLW